MPFNISPNFLQKVALLESGNNPMAKSPKSTAKGLYQFTDPTAKSYGLSDPFDPIASTEAFKSLTSDNAVKLKSILGREPTEAELYLAHQQGAAGAAKLIQNPDRPAATLVGLKQVKNNGGNGNMTAADFADMWKQKYEGAGNDPVGGHMLQPVAQFADSGQIMNDASDPNDLFAQAGIDTKAQDQNDLLSDPAPQDDLLSNSPEAASNFKHNAGGGALDTGKLRTAVDSFNQGTMAGWGSDITDPLAAFYAALKTDPMGAMRGEVNDPALAENINDLRDNSMQTLAAGREENPWTAGLSQVAGALTGAAGASKLVPSGVAKTAAKVAQAAPNLTAAAIGGGGAAVNALGEAPHTGLERFDNLGWNVPLGMAGGVAGYQLAKAGGKAVNALSDRFGPQVKETLGGILGGADDLPPPPGGAAPDLSPMKLAGILDEEDAAKLAKGRVLPMTAGERGQNVNVQRMEEVAKKSGSVPFQKAVAAQQDAAYKPLTSILGETQQLDPIALNGRTQDEITGAANILRDQYDQLGNKVNQAYNTAAQGSGGVAIRASDINNDFMGKVADTMAMENVRPGDIPKLDDNLNELKDILNPADNATTTAVKLDKLEAWKKRLNRTIGNTAEPADQRIVKMIGRHYDDFMGNLADDAIVNGDTSAIDAFKNARSLASQKFRFYDSDTGIQKILDNRELSGTQLVNTVLGANRMVGKGDDGRLVETMLDLAGDRAPEMQNAMRRGVMAKVLNDSLSGTTDATTVGTAAERKLLDFGKMKKSLGSLMQQRETFGALFDDTEQSYFKQMYKDIDQIASKQPGAVNNSSTGAYMADMVNGLGKIINNPLLKNIMGAGAVTTAVQGGLEKQAASMVTGKAEKGLGEFLAQAFKQVDAPKVFYGGIGGSSAVDPIGNIANHLISGGKDDSNGN